MDAFYASVEQRDRIELRGKPVVVGGSNPQSRGVVSTASYEAREFGIHSAMPLAEAFRRCPEAVFLPVDGAKYRAVSREIRKIFCDYTPLVEPLSLDEAFLDVTGSTGLFGPAVKIARLIKNRIQEELNLTASVGVAGNKFLAKLASDLQKPDGFVVIEPGRVQPVLDPLPVQRLWGVGTRSAEQLYALNIRTVRDLRSMPLQQLVRLFGTQGQQLYQLARGVDERAVEPVREVKSVGRESTFAEDISDREELGRILLELSLEVGRSLRKDALKGRTVTLKLRFNDFRTISRSTTLVNATNLDENIYGAARGLLDEVSLLRPVRLIGVSLHNLTDRTAEQLSLFAAADESKERLAKAVDAVKDKFGDKSITRARLLEPKE